MSDLIERLRRDDGFGSYDLRKQAADEIERLTAQVERFSYLETDWKRRNHIIESQAERIAELEAALQHLVNCHAERLRVADLTCGVCDEIAEAALKGDNDA